MTMRTPEAWEGDICEMQGRLLEQAWRKDYDMAAFVPAFMQSDVVAALDAPYSRYQWMGEEYALSSVLKETRLVPGCKCDDTDPEALFWMGYTYRYWHYLTGETSREMYAIADFQRMKTVYAGYHTVSSEKAVEWLRSGNRSEGVRNPSATTRGCSSVNCTMRWAVPDSAHFTEMRPRDATS